MLLGVLAEAAEAEVVGVVSAGAGALAYWACVREGRASRETRSRM
jgi:hypothetical protein